MNEHPVWNYIDQNAERFFTLADNVWNTPETCYAEKSSVEFHRNELSYQGFKITEIFYIIRKIKPRNLTFVREMIQPGKPFIMVYYY